MQLGCIILISEKSTFQKVLINVYLGFQVGDVTRKSEQPNSLYPSQKDGYVGTNIKFNYNVLIKKVPNRLPMIIQHGAYVGPLGLMECQKYVLYVVRKH